MDPTSILDPGNGNNPGAGGSGETLLGNALPGSGQSGGGTTPETLPQREWMNDLPEPLKATKTLTKFADKAALAKSYVELESKHSKSVEIPGKDSGPEDWARFYDKVGRPKTADEYALDRGNAPDDVAKAFKQMAFESGLTAQQADTMFKGIMKRQSTEQQTAVEQYTARMKEADTLLRREYGPQYDSKIASAKKAFGAVFSDPELRSEVTQSGLANNPRFIKVLAELGTQISDDSFLQGGNASTESKDPLAAYFKKRFGTDE